MSIITEQDYTKDVIQQEEDVMGGWRVVVNTHQRSLDQGRENGLMIARDDLVRN